MRGLQHLTKLQLMPPPLPCHLGLLHPPYPFSHILAEFLAETSARGEGNTGQWGHAPLMVNAEALVQRIGCETPFP